MVQRQFLLYPPHVHRKSALFLTGITGADKFTVLRNTATRNGGFRGILDPVKDVSVSVYARVREPQRQRTAIMGSGRRQVSGCLPVEAPHK